MAEAARYVIRGAGGFARPVALDFEDALVELRALALERGERLTVHRASDGAELGSCGPVGARGPARAPTPRQLVERSRPARPRWVGRRGRVER